VLPFTELVVSRAVRRYLSWQFQDRGSITDCIHCTAES
jgi:hypothetical protein